LFSARTQWRRAAKHFNLEWAEMEERHALNFETHEEGRMTFKEYLDRVIFCKKRSFTRTEFRSFMFAQSKPVAGMIELVRNLKAKYELKIIVVSNESRELNAYRIREFKLAGFMDAFISSCYVRLRKPDEDIFKLALDTLSHGIFDEIYYPRIDQACIRDLGLIVTDGGRFFSEENRCDRYQLGLELGGGRDLPDPSRVSRARGNFLVIRCNRDRCLDLLLSAGAGNHREKS
jgi:hypothetical protein